MKVLFVGFGDLAGRCAEALIAHGHDVYGLGRRKQPPLPDVHWIQADVAASKGLETLAGGYWDIVVVTLTPGERSEQAYHSVFVEGLRNLLGVLDQAPPGLLLFASSTSVYSQHQGEWVDETTELVADGSIRNEP